MIYKQTEGLGRIPERPFHFKMFFLLFDNLNYLISFLIFLEMRVKPGTYRFNEKQPIQVLFFFHIIFHTTRSFSGRLLNKCKNLCGCQVMSCLKTVSGYSGIHILIIQDWGFTVKTANFNLNNYEIISIDPSLLSLSSQKLSMQIAT